MCVFLHLREEISHWGVRVFLDLFVWGVQIGTLLQDLMIQGWYGLMPGQGTAEEILHPISSPLAWIVFLGHVAGILWLPFSLSRVLVLGLGRRS